MAILVSLRYLVKEDAKLSSRRQNAVCVDYLLDSCKISPSSRNGMSFHNRDMSCDLDDRYGKTKK